MYIYFSQSEKVFRVGMYVRIHTRVVSMIYKIKISMGDFRDRDAIFSRGGT